MALLQWTEARADLTRARSLDKGVDADVRKELHRLKSLESQRKQHETKFFKSMFAESEIYSESEVRGSRTWSASLALVEVQQLVTACRNSVKVVMIVLKFHFNSTCIDTSKM